jgi:SAM-dependent methyltransferase
MTDPEGPDDPISRWNTRWTGDYTNSREDWDERAADWDTRLRGEDVRARQGAERVGAVATWLRARDLLNPDHAVVDVGCGPGRFVAEFARSARSAIGLDFSARMVEAGRRLARERGLENTEFHVCDFQGAGPFDSAWEGAFDLAFSSITPAISGLEALERFIRMSRAWCMNICFIHLHNDLHDRVLSEVFGRGPRRQTTGHSYWRKELGDVLRHLGFRPEVATWDQPRELALPADRATAEALTRALLPPPERGGDAVRRIEKFLCELATPDGTVTEHSHCRYGWTLWDVRKGPPIHIPPRDVRL